MSAIHIDIHVPECVSKSVSTYVNDIGDDIVWRVVIVGLTLLPLCAKLQEEKLLEFRKRAKAQWMPSK
jgi:hypothetical protein